MRQPAYDAYREDCCVGSGGGHKAPPLEKWGWRKRGGEAGRRDGREVCERDGVENEGSNPMRLQDVPGCLDNRQPPPTMRAS